MFVAGCFLDLCLILFLFSEFAGEFGIRFKHFFELGICPAIEANFREHFKSVFVFIRLFRGDSIDDIFFENANSLNFSEYFIHAAGAIARPLFQQFRDDPIHLGSHIGVEFRGIRRFSPQVLLQQLFGRRGLEGGLAGQHLEEHHTQAVHIGLKCRLLFSDGFWGDVSSGPLDCLQFSGKELPESLFLF